MPATGKTALRTGLDVDMFFSGGCFVKHLFHGMGPPLLSSFKDLAGAMGKFAWIGIFAALVVAGAAWSAPATEALIAETQAALDKGDALHAVNLADAALNDGAVSASERGRLLLYRGLAEELLGLHDPAMRGFTAALDTHALPAEERAQALLQRGFLRDGLGQLDKAARDYTAVIALKGDSLAIALNNRANIYRRQNRLVEARRDYQASLSAGGGKPQYAWYGLGQIAETQADTVAARGFYARAVAADSSYALASERLEALGGPPENAIAGPQDPILLRPPAAAVVSVAAQASKDAAGAVVLHPPRREAQNQNGQSSDASPQRGGNSIQVVLRPALDQTGGRARARGPDQGAIEVQLGAWRSKGEANAGWDQARLRAGGALNGFNPHIVTADLPGRGRYYRLRVSVAAGQSRSAFCAGLSAKGVTCLPARD
jgi:tetratricopeptide (TPR) repeat protein